MKKWIGGLLVAGLLSVGGYNAIKSHEGLVLCAYPDPATKADPWTIGYGHTGPDVKPGQCITKARADELLREDTAKAEAVVRKYAKVPMRQGQWDSNVSFVFNAGAENYRKSTLLRKLNAGDWRGSCREFPKWVYANKKVMRGLKIRRTEEMTTCLKEGPYVYYP